MSSAKPPAQGSGTFKHPALSYCPAGYGGGNDPQRAGVAANLCRDHNDPDRVLRRFSWERPADTPS